MLIAELFTDQMAFYTLLFCTIIQPQQFPTSEQHIPGGMELVENNASARKMYPLRSPYWYILLIRLTILFFIEYFHAKAMRSKNQLT
jgi:hypothetical protein